MTIGGGNVTATLWVLGTLAVIGADTTGFAMASPVGAGQP